MINAENSPVSRDPSSEGSQEAPGAQVTPLIPTRLALLIEERPLLWIERPDDYDALLAEVFAELAPRGVIECILVKDIVDYIWEARRFRRLKVAAVHASLPAAASRILAKDYCGGYYRDAGHIKKLARAAAAQVDDGADESLASRADEDHVTSEVLHYGAYNEAVTEIFDISREVERLERRRDQLLKQLGDRRAALAAMARSLIKREQAETIELQPQTA